MKKTKILFILLLSLSSLFIACDKGEDSVDFTYSQDSKDPRIFYFQASGSSDYGDFDYRWDFGKGNTASGSNASHQFDDYGNHVVTLYADIDKSGIHSTVSKKIEIDIPKITNVDFSYTTSSTNPKEYYFTATGKSNYSTVNFEWDFGQNNIETRERATAEFGEYGFNDVTLTASIKNLGNDIEAVSTSKTIEVLAPEFRDLDFTYTTNSEDGRVLYLKANSKVTYGTVNYRWNFGNGQGQSGEETSFTFDSYGKKTIQLTGTIKETGISTTRTMTVDVHLPVFKNFNINYEVSNSNPLTVFLTASAKSEQGGKLSYQWNLGQGVIYTGQNITHTFDSYGEKTITITVKNTDADIEDTKTEIITLDTPVIKDLAYTYKRDKNTPLKAYFTASSNSDYDITYEWDFGDGKIKTGKVIDVSFDNFGEKTITLKAVIKDLNLENEYIKKIDFTTPNIKNLQMQIYYDKKNKLKHNFTANAEIDYGELEFEWDFGNGNIKEGNNINFTFDYYDAYNVKLIAKVAGTKVKTETTKPLDLTNLSDISFECSYISANETEADFLKAMCKPDLGNEILSGIRYDWDFGDPASGVIENSSSDERAVHKFTRSDLYKVTLCVNANELITPLCVSKNIGILEEPKSGLSYNDNTGYSLKDGKNTWGRELRLTNVWKELIKDGRINVTSVIFNSHIGCYGKADKNINGTRIITEKDVNTDLLAREECDAENSAGSRRGKENVTYTLKNGFRITKENM